MDPLILHFVRKRTVADIYIYIYMYVWQSCDKWARNEKRKWGLPVVDLDVVNKLPEPRLLRTKVFTLLLN